jgi:hypothetical protein
MSCGRPRVDSGGTNLLLEGLGGEVAERQRKVLTIIAEESKRD